MVGGTVGALLTGVFATMLVNPGIADLTTASPAAGWPAGQTVHRRHRHLSFRGIGTLVILTVVNAIFKLRPAVEDEIVGMDLSQHSERAYTVGSEPIALAYGAVGEPKAA